VRRILVIRDGPLRDFVLSLGSFAAIRAHHPRDQITILTTKPFAEMAWAAPWFDEVWTDEQPSVWRIGRWVGLGARLRDGGFARVYDLQTDERSGWYFQLMDRPEWSGTVPGCSHRHIDARRDFLHPEQRIAEQLALAGIAEVPAPDLRWLRADLDRFGLPASYALLLPGGAPAARWPAEHFAALGRRLLDAGVTPAVVGLEDEAELAAAVATACPGALDLAGRTTLCELATLGRGARVAIGGDSGAMPLLAAAGCPAVVLAAGEPKPMPRTPHGPLSVVRGERIEVIGIDAAAAVALT
jgi:ADP-heptose:LPS heptosyltransferase